MADPIYGIFDQILDIFKIAYPNDINYIEQQLHLI